MKQEPTSGLDPESDSDIGIVSCTFAASRAQPWAQLPTPSVRSVVIKQEPRGNVPSGPSAVAAVKQEPRDGVPSGPSAAVAVKQEPGMARQGLDAGAAAVDLTLDSGEGEEGRRLVQVGSEGGALPGLGKCLHATACFCCFCSNATRDSCWTQGKGRAKCLLRPLVTCSRPARAAPAAAACARTARRSRRRAARAAAATAAALPCSAWRQSVL